MLRNHNHLRLLFFAVQGQSFRSPAPPGTWHLSCHITLFRAINFECMILSCRFLSSVVLVAYAAWASIWKHMMNQKIKLNFSHVFEIIVILE